MVPEVHKWEAGQLLIASLAAGGLMLCAASEPAAQGRGLTRVVYEFAVTSYCGTLDPAVEAGFQAELKAVTQRSGLDSEAARQQRLRGWIEAEQEWRNRGLGGNRAWCAGEGVEAARHFQAIARGERQP
jgi:hypothetical protein